MKQIKKRKDVRVLEYMLSYVPADHTLFSICKGFEPGKFTVKAVNEKGTSESVIAVCPTRKTAKEIIEQDLNGNIINLI
ncbi:MAG TPA: hypothetical protein VNZ49_11935 [Bacteroidia bacterium]|jgi:hypothetical protein|nr:hypothetical protein [Bacteroidia bacterium]